jgi:hypothetical protein
MSAWTNRRGMAFLRTLGRVLAIRKLMKHPPKMDPDFSGLKVHEHDVRRRLVPSPERNIVELTPNP